MEIELSIGKTLLQFILQQIRILRNPICREIVSNMETFVLQRDAGIPQGMSNEKITETLMHILDCPDCSTERERICQELPSNIHVLKQEF